ncbi:MAG: NADH:flavin oxidoreductase [Promethearchaeota archaeon]|nr:MAG: NADH:flavin oxidoreductase [Candidatus Lokiarchaeota archaeon]
MTIGQLKLNDFTHIIMVIKLALETLFSPKKIGSVKIKNRLMRSATFEGLASREGYVTDELVGFYIELARGGIGLIITGASAVTSRMTVGSRCACFTDDSFVKAHQTLVKSVHEYNNVKIGAQLAHNGRQGSHPKYLPVAPSPVFYPLTKQIPRELTGREIYDIIDHYAAAGRRVYESGYDLVQLHAAHGYLLSSFLSPYTNKRTDEFGETLAGRTKILIDIYNRLRDEVGKNFPIIVKLQVIDGVPGGLTIAEGKQIAERLIKAGYDAIEPSGGLTELQMKTDNALPSKRIKSADDENYLSAAVKHIRPIMGNSALIQVGGIRNPETAEKLLRSGMCDFIALSRPLIYEPNLPDRWKNGDHSPAKCISCNSCLLAIFTGQGVHCAVKRKLEHKMQKIDN